MLTENLIRFADKFGWQKAEKDNLAFGLYKDYPFTIVDGRSFKAFITPVAGISQSGLKSFNDYLTEQSRALKLRNFEFADNFLCVRVKEPLFSLPIEKMEQVMDLLADRLEAYQVAKTACVVCGEPATKRGLYFGLYTHLHSSCSERDPVDFTTIREDDFVDTAESGTMQAYLPAMTDALVRLCRIPSVKDEPAPGAPYGQATLDALNEFLKIGESLGMRAVNLDGRAGYVEAGEGDRLVAALCHLDVVPAGTGWNHDPFDPVVTDERIIARGTADDKGPAVAALYALKALLDEGYQPNARIRVIVGLDEESGSSCMAHYVSVEELPDAGFTPDASFPVIYAEKGIVWYRLSFDRDPSGPEAELALVSGEGGERPNMVPGSCSLTYLENGATSTVEYTGQPAHGSRPDQGVNAIAIAMDDAQERLRQANLDDPFVTAFNRLIGRQTDGDACGIAGSDESGALTLNAGVLSLSPDQATLELDIRYPVTWDLKDLEQRLSDQAGSHGFRTELIRAQDPLYFPKDTPLVQNLMQVYHSITQDDAQPLAIGGGTYARSMPHVVAFGPAFPGDPDVCHQAGESIRLDNFEKAARIYREAFRKLTLEQDPG